MLEEKQQAQEVGYERKAGLRTEGCIFSVFLQR
jgi:hypothetical protein